MGDITDIFHDGYVDGLVQERRKSIASAVELRLSCTNPSIFSFGKTPPLYWNTRHANHYSFCLIITHFRPSNPHFA